MNIRLKTKAAFIGLLVFLALMTAASGCSRQETNLPVVLFSDFGTGDYRVSQLKGIILSQNAGVNLIDASHAVPAFDVPTGAFMLYMAAREFPAGVVFVAVVDPYTGPEPRYLVLTTNKDQIFVLPDNGLLTYVARDMGIKSIYSVDNRKLFNQPISELSAERLEGTVGGKISSGYSLQDIGAPVSDQVILNIQEPAIADDKLLGTVIFVDNFGNCVTNIEESIAVRFGLIPGDTIEVQSTRDGVPARYGKIYSDVAEGKEIVFVNNNLGVIQLSINLGNYSAKHSLKAGGKVAIEKK